MVRLKENLKSFLVINNLVSIPYGSIKSRKRGLKFSYYAMFQFRMVRLKDKEPKPDKNGRHTFQFRMVRLKDHAARKRRRDCEVSIPYGSIKSCNKSGLDWLHSLFQFRMVRLKDGIKLQKEIAVSLFQFRMVRLKARGTRFEVSHSSLFQFRMVRLKVVLL